VAGVRDAQVVQALRQLPRRPQEVVVLRHYAARSRPIIPSTWPTSGTS
jgi:hypothetical protein